MAVLNIFFLLRFTKVALVKASNGYDAIVFLRLGLVY